MSSCHDSLRSRPVPFWDDIVMTKDRLKKSDMPWPFSSSHSSITQQRVKTLFWWTISSNVLCYTFIKANHSHKLHDWTSRHIKTENN